MENDHYRLIYRVRRRVRAAFVMGVVLGLMGSQVVLGETATATYPGGAAGWTDEVWLIDGINDVSVSHPDNRNILGVDYVFDAVVNDGRVKVNGDQINLQSLRIDGGTVAGYGAILGRVVGEANSRIEAAGNFSLGELSRTDGFATAGVLDLGAHVVTLLDGDVAALDGLTMLNGGQLLATNGIAIGAAGSLNGRGIVGAAVLNTGRIEGTGTLQFDGMLQGQGTGVSGNILRFGNGGGYEGGGAIQAAVDGLAGSRIEATGNLVLGKAGAANGFETAGALVVGAHRVTLLDSDGSGLGAETSLAGGTLIAGSGVSLGRRDLLMGVGDLLGNVYNEGTIESTGLFFHDPVVNVAGATVMNVGGVQFDRGYGGAGSVLGEPSEVVTIYGQHTVGEGGGVDTTSTVTIGSSVLYGESTEVVFELGGTAVGEFDRLEVGGTFDLAGGLHVDFLEGYRPMAGDVFEIIGAEGGLLGAFDEITTPQWAEGMEMLVEVIEGGEGVTGGVRLLAAIPGDFDLNGRVDVADLSIWATGFGSTDAVFEEGDSNLDGRVDVVDLSSWATWFGTVGSDFEVGGLLEVNGAVRGVVSVPEPGGIVLMGVLGLGLGMRRGRCRRF